MPQIIAVDGGNFETKVVHSRGYDCFSSALGEYRKRRVSETHSDQDMVFHIVNKYDNIKGFAGPLASIESEYGGTTFGISKNHQDAKIRILLGVWRNLQDYTVNLIVGQPYKSHTDEEKNEIIKSLQGDHVVIVNGKRKEFRIENVLVGVEGGMAFWSQPKNGEVNIVDIGSGTVNCIHFKDKRIVDRKCDTLPFGSETNIDGVNFEEMSKAIARNMSSKWNKNDITLVCGGSAEMILEPLKRYFPNSATIKPVTTIADISTKLDTKFANAVGMYIVGSRAYGKLQAG